MNLALLSDYSTNAGVEATQEFTSKVFTRTQRISVAYFASQPDAERFFFKKTEIFYRSIGIEEVHYIEIEDGFNADSTQEKLSSSIIHLSGGDTYRFLYWLKARGLDKLIANEAKAGKPIIGVSAGAMILTPSVESASLCGDKNTVGLKETSALNLTSFLFSPHATKCKSEELQASNLSSQTGLDVVLCSDSDAVLIIDSKLHEIGNPKWVTSILQA